MKKLNNKGFAIASILYSIMVLFLLLLLSILGILGSRKAILDKNKKDILDSLNNEVLQGNLKDKVLAHGYSVEFPDFSDVEVQDAGLFETVDSDGKSYYYRGDINYNYISFAGYLWRIIRINGDGSVRIIMNGDIGVSTFNNVADSVKYSGYTYDKETNETDSTIKSYLENWYNNNLNGYDNYIVISRYCNDSSVYKGDINSNPQTAVLYGASNRLQNLNQPSLICEAENNSFGGEYLLKIGLISLDELVMAGGYYMSDNVDYYLYYNANWWTMTPHSYSVTYSCIGVGRTYKNESYRNGCVNNSDHVVRPVINLKGDIIVSGTGTKNNPYVIVNL